MNNKIKVSIICTIFLYHGDFWYNDLSTFPPCNEQTFDLRKTDNPQETRCEYPYISYKVFNV